MPTPASYYQVRMGCDNCGFITLYEIPMRFEITDACRCPDCDRYSSISKHNSEEHKLLFCQNCNVPALKVFWSTNEEPARQPQEFQR